MQYINGHDETMSNDTMDWEDLESLSQITESQLIDALIPPIRVAYLLDDRGNKVWIDKPRNGMFVKRIHGFTKRDDAPEFSKRICLSTRCNRTEDVHDEHCILTKSLERARERIN